MKRQYTGFPIQNPKLKGEDKLWLPILNVRLGKGFNKKTPLFPAVVDSGSPYCLFRADLAQFLGIDLSAGTESQIGGIIAGPQEAIYFHQVKLYVENNWMIDITAGFIKKLSVTAILGRRDFFDNFKILFDQTVIPSTVEITKIERGTVN